MLKKFCANRFPFGLFEYLLSWCTYIYLGPYALGTSVTNNGITFMCVILNVDINQMIFILLIIYEGGQKSDRNMNM